MVARVYAINTAAQLIFRRRGDEWIFETHTHTATHLYTVTSARHGDGVHACGWNAPNLPRSVLSAAAHRDRQTQLPLLCDAFSFFEGDDDDAPTLGRIAASVE